MQLEGRIKLPEAEVGDGHWGGGGGATPQHVHTQTAIRLDHSPSQCHSNLKCCVGVPSDGGPRSTHKAIRPRTLSLPDRACTFARPPGPQVLDLFPSSFLHLGGDEASQFRDAAYNAEPGRRVKAALGIPDNERLQGHLLDRLTAFVGEYQKRVLAWDDSFVDLRGYAPDRAKTVLVWWRDWAPEASFDKIMRLGYPVVAAPTSKSYLDLFQMEPHSQSAYSVQAGTVHLRNAWEIGLLQHQNIIGLQVPAPSPSLGPAPTHPCPPPLFHPPAHSLPSPRPAPAHCASTALSRHGGPSARRFPDFQRAYARGEGWGDLPPSFRPVPLSYAKDQQQ